MKRILLFCMSLWTLCAFTTTAVADEVDYTSSIVNANLSTTDAWNAEGTKGISGGVVKVGSGSSFDFSQTITIPAGHYKMTAKAAYRYGANEQEEYDAIQAGANTHLAKLYAQTAAQTFEANVFNRYEGASETDYAAGSGSVTVNGLFVPNSSDAVKAWFNADQYVNVLEFDVLEDGDVKIGIVKTESAANGDYANIGAWTLTRTGDAQNTGEGEGEGTPVVEAYFADGDYLIVNTETGYYLGGGNDWGTHATLLGKPQFFTLAHQGDNAYTLDSHQSNGGANHFLSTGLYCDGAAANWTFTKNENGNYTINNAGNYLAGNGTNKVIITVTEPTTASEWTIISKADAFAALDAATKENPVDATIYITNPECKRNAGGWTVTSADGTGTPSNSAMGSNDATANCAESYHSSNGFDFSQVLVGMKPGVYRLDGHAFYRNDNDATGTFPYFYVNDQQSVFPALTGSENSMASAYASFLNGAYGIVPIYFTVEEGDEVKIGVHGENTAFWNIWGEFGLTYYGTEASIAEIKAGAVYADYNNATGKSMNAEISAAMEAAKVAYEADPSDDNLAAFIAAVASATSSVDVYANSKVAIDNMCDLLASTNVYTQEAYETFKAAADAYLAKYDEGTLVETVVDPYAITGWRATGITHDDLLISAWGIAPEMWDDMHVNTWSVEGGNDGTNFNVPFIEYWTGDANSLAATTKTATVAGLTPGASYKVSAWVRVRAKNGQTDPTGISLKVGDGLSVDVTEGAQVGTSQFFLAEYVAMGTADAEGNLTISFNIAADNNISWLSFKNVKYAEVSTGKNLDFSESTPIDNGICTCDYDEEKNGTTYSQMQSVTGWEFGNDNGNNRAAGVFAYGGTPWLGGTGYLAPATNPEGVAEGNALGIVSTWGSTTSYKQSVTLAPGNYVLTIPVYNSVGGTQVPSKSLIGFIANDGTEYLAPAKAYPVNTWTTEVVTFTLDKVTEGVLSLGYVSPGAGSGSNPHLFFDCVKIEVVSNVALVKAELASAIASAQATVDAKAGVGEGVFMIPTAALDTYAAAVVAAQAVYDNAEATADDVTAAIEALAAATATYAATPATAPAADKTYHIMHEAAGTFLALNGGVKVEAEASPLSFVAAGDGKYYIANANGEYAYYSGTGNNIWSLNVSADNKEAWTIAAVGEGVYTIKGKNGFLGTDAATAGSTCYGDKAATNWVITEYVAPVVPFEVTLVNPAEGTTKLEEGDSIKFTTNIEDAYILVGVLQVSDEDPTNTEYLASYRAAVKGESDWSVELFSTMKFRQGYTYKFEFTAYESEDAYNQEPYDAPGSAAIGTDTIAFVGTLPAYVYATATLNDIKPAYNSVIENEADSIVTLTFSEPVKVVYAQTAKSEGRFMPPTLIDLVPVAVEADENGLATVWTVAMPLLPGFSNISFAAEDAEGRRVWGNMGEEETSYFSYEWQCTVGVPDVKVAPAGYVAGPVNTLTVTSDVQVDPNMWNGGVYDAEGNLVAEFASLDKIVDESLEQWTEEWFAAMAAAPVTVTLTNAITEPGTYTVKFLAGSFMLGETYNSKATEATFAIIPAENLVEVNVERIVNLGYTADEVTVDIAAICEKLGIASISEATVWGVNATTLEYVADAFTTCDGWMNPDGDFTTWTNSNSYVCYKNSDNGVYALCTRPENEPVLGTVYTAYRAYTTATDTVVLKTNITFVEAPKVEVEVVKTITIEHEEKAGVSFQNTQATFDVAEVAAALGIENLANVETFIVNVTTGEFVANTTDGWRNSQGDATMWGNLDEGSVCVKLADPTSGVFNEIHNYDTSYAAGDTYTAKWAIVYEGKAVVLDLVIKYVVEVGINGISADDVVKTQYFGINGAAIDAPAKGVNIVKQTLKNGKVVTSKVYVK